MTQRSVATNIWNVPSRNPFITACRFACGHCPAVRRPDSGFRRLFPETFGQVFGAREDQNRLSIGMAQQFEECGVEALTDG